ncbi:FHA domain-containing protein, partial [Brachybacterium hainanense]
RSAPAPAVPRAPAVPSEPAVQAGPGTPPVPAAPSAPVTPSPLAPSGTPPSGTQQVLLSGRLCGAGHANPPELMGCRVCGRTLVGPSRTVPRPLLGRVELSTGESFPLDRSAIIGRRPRASRFSGHEVPQLITVPSPQQDISRSHVELRLEGWHVIAVDLGTTNGTALLREGMDPRRLAPQQGTVLRDLDILDLGDGIRLRLREGA